ncbi:hypothetical protein IF650_18995 [Cellulosimicrobium terreum]|nr:hypothetical protein [Cellulosimicrobium terreum]
MSTPEPLTVSDERRADRTAYLEGLLPAHVRERDAATGGLLHALLDAVAGELAVVEEDLESLYDAWFVETAPAWVVPYLADLVGVTGLPEDVGDAGAGRRAVTANTVTYRQGKGTVAVLEQVVRDATGWPAVAVEFYRRLATTAHVNHLRPDRPAWVSLRSAADVELTSPQLAAGALSRTARTGEVRPVEPGPTGGRGRFGIPAVGVFVFRTQVYDAVAAPARPGTGGWRTHPLGLDEPWFAAPATEESVEHLAGEADLPVPLRPRRLLAALEAARAGVPAEPVPLAVRVEDDPPLEPERVRVCGVEDLAPLDGWQVMVDAVTGRVQPYLDGDPADPAALHTDHAYGAVADVGAGTQDRSDTHEDTLAADPFTGDADRGGADVLGVQGQVAVRSVPPPGAGEPGLEPSVAAAVATTTTVWTDPAATGGTHVVSVGDSEAYPGGLVVDVPAETRLVLVAAAWRGRELLSGDVEAPVPGVYSPEGLRPRVVGDVVVTGAGGSSVVLDGLVVEGDVVVAPGDLGSLTLGQCTVAGRIRVEADTTAGPDDPEAGNRALRVTLRRSRAAGVDLAPTVGRLSVTDCVLDSLQGTGGGTCVEAPGARASIDGSTLRGDAGCRVLELTSSVCDGVVTVVDAQRGCARFSYLGPGSRTPRRFRCVPPSDRETSDAPSYVSTAPGSPSYAALAASTPASIRRGGEHDAEMGVHHHLRRPSRLDAARRLVAPYVPAGMQIGMFGS